VEAAVDEPRPGRYVIQAANSPRLVARLAAWLEQHDVELGELQAGKRSLEDVFLRLTEDTGRTREPAA
jgi:ABC-2 type transport system ATP-binding protein